MDKFLEEIDKLRLKHFPQSFKFKQDRHSASCYLAFFAPDQNYIYRYSNAEDFAQHVEFGMDIGSGGSFRLDAYYKLCDIIVEALREHTTLLEKHFAFLSERCYRDESLHLLAFDLLVRLKYYKAEDASLSTDNPYNAKKVKNRTFYSSNQSNGDDYMKYMDKGAKAGEVYDYMAYAGNEEKSSGVFGKDGFLTERQKKEIRQMLRSTKSVIWDMVISFTEDYGNEHIKSYADAMEVIKQNLPQFFKENGLQVLVTRNLCSLLYRYEYNSL